MAIINIVIYKLYLGCLNLDNTVNITNNNQFHRDNKQIINNNKRKIEQISKNNNIKKDTNNDIDNIFASLF